MEEIKIFGNESFGNIRVTSNNNIPLFCANDICRDLDYANPRKAVSDHVDSDDITKRYITDSLGRNQLTTFINESGLYSLIMGSHLPQAKKFKRWITADVLPSIRKTGGYLETEESDTPEIIMARALVVAQDTIKKHEERLKVLEYQNRLLVHQSRLYTTTEIAKELGMNSAIVLNMRLMQLKIQFKQNNTWILYSKFADKGYVSIKQEVLDNGKVIYNRKWTGAGRQFVLNLISGIG